MLDKSQDFLIEIGCEELPPAALEKLAHSLTKQIGIGLDQHRLAHGELQTYATPRRLAVIVRHLLEKQSDILIEKKGPSLENAFDENRKPTKACEGFVQSCGITMNELIEIDSPKGRCVGYRYLEQGKETVTLLPEIVTEAIRELPIPKPMRWGVSDTSFARPVHWVVMLYGKQVVETTILGIHTGDKTYGHRFHHPDPLHIKHVKDYAELLFKQGHVIADLALRQHHITQQIEALLTSELPKAKALISADLLAEVNAIVEWPKAFLGRFDESFLQVPKEVLISAMQSHQKCFPVVHKDNPEQLLPYFVFVSNIDTKDSAAVISGNERVMRARLNDAAFFFEKDKQQTLASYLKDLEQIIYQKQLGSLRDKVQRLSALSKIIAENLREDKQAALRAGLLSKCDLKTDMVGEFPSLQGIMGYYYALHDGETLELATALKEHYQPRFANDAIPASGLGAIVAIADKVDTLVGIIGIGQHPTGDKDPFGLRRAALGILRIVIEKQYDLDLRELFVFALEQYKVPLSNQQVIEDLIQFTFERLRTWYAGSNGKADVFAAVSARNITKPLDFINRLKAVEQFLTLPEAASLSSANKRVSNLLKKSQNSLSAMKVNPALLRETAEKTLEETITKQKIVLSPLIEKGRYTETLSALASLQKPADDFFETVMVMVEDKALQENRLALLNELRNLFLTVADISLLQV
ncbi:MAG: glycine-tRNA ligase [Gammaproteobacteria bacterium]|jgi:glycyl-tRNA synthetase beta chain|nr:glycine-tRNA ligase [Gammaproteobacteria bacterium]